MSTNLQQYTLTPDEERTLTLAEGSLIEELGCRWERAAAPGDWSVEVVRADGSHVVTMCGTKQAPKPRIGRPIMPAGRAKTSRVQLKLRPSDKEIWVRKAKAAGLTLQAWVELQCGGQYWRR